MAALKKELKKEIHHLLKEKGVDGENITKILNTLVNYTYSKIDKIESIQISSQQQIKE